MSRFISSHLSRSFSSVFPPLSSPSRSLTETSSICANAHLSAGETLELGKKAEHDLENEKKGAITCTTPAREESVRNAKVSNKERENSPECTPTLRIAWESHHEQNVH